MTSAVTTVTRRTTMRELEALFENHDFNSFPGGQEIYFHHNSVLNDDFSHLRVGSRVTYAEEMGDKGAQASTVRDGQARAEKMK